MGDFCSVRAPFRRPHARLPKIRDGVRPHLAMPRVVREALDVLAQAIGVEMLAGPNNSRVEHSPALLEQAAVGALVRKGMLERVLDFGKKPGLVQEFGGLQPRETLMQFVVAQASNGFEQTKRDVLADDRCRLQEALVFGCESIDAGRDDRLCRRRYLERVE